MKPFTMWAGGKGRLLRRYDRSWFERPGGFDFYYEPFLGGGSVFSWLSDAGLLPDRVGGARRIVLSDSNAELMGVYRAVRDDIDGLEDELDGLIDDYLGVDGKPARKEWYYGLREAYWGDPTPGRLLMLLRTGFNGIWQSGRYSRGLYGAAAGRLNHTDPRQIYDPANLREWHDALRGVTALRKTQSTRAAHHPPPFLVVLFPPAFPRVTLPVFSNAVACRAPPLFFRVDSPSLRLPFSRTAFIPPHVAFLVFPHLFSRIPACFFADPPSVRRPRPVSSHASSAPLTTPFRPTLLAPAPLSLALSPPPPGFGRSGRASPRSFPARLPRSVVSTYVDIRAPSDWWRVHICG